MKDRYDKNDKLIHLEPLIKAKREEGTIIGILRDSRRIAKTIEKRACILCNKVKICVNKTGLCAACYINLTSREKKVADEEAGHKRIEFKVSDDRWDDTNEH